MTRPFLISLYTSVSLLCSVRGIYGQDPAVPSEWKNTQSNLSTSDRKAFALGTATRLNAQSPEEELSDEKNFISNLASLALVLASHDLLNNDGNWASRVYGVFQNHDDKLVFNDDFAYFGLAELSASLAYDDSARRDNATWYHWGAIYNNSFISAVDVQSNMFPRNLTTTTDCGGTLGGMIFEYNDNAMQDVVTRAISPWILLSSQLADLSHESTSIYLQAAEMSIQFMQGHLLNLTAEGPSIVAHTFNASTCEPSFDSSTSADLAQFIEGLSIVANITHNQNYTQLLSDLIPRAVRAWTDPQGVMFEGDGDLGKGYMVRGLLEARRRNPSNTAINNLIDAFINVQVNAVRTNANATNNNYNSSWIGHADSSGPYNLLGGILALNVFNAASAMAPPDQSLNQTGGSTTNVRAIVGAVVGGVAGAVACALVGLIYLRQNRARKLQLHEDGVELSTPAKAEGVLEPYMLTRSGTQRPANSKGGGGSYSRMEDLSATDDSDVTAQSTSDGPPAVVDHGPDVVSGLARRLDNLIDALAIRSEVDGLPPDYETRVARSDVASRR